MAILTTVGRAALAAAIRARTLHLAWGEGDPLWDSAPIPESLAATSLVAELGRASLTASDFVTPDPVGAIEVPTGFYTVSASPTNHLYLRFDFGFDDAADKTIRETGLYMDTVVASGLPAGQRYFTPAQVTSTGTLVALEYFSGIVRSPVVRQSFEFVLTI